MSAENTRPEAVISFDRFRFDPKQMCLWSEEQEVELRPTSLAVLHYLVTHPGQLVTKQELLTTVWAGTQVGDGVVKVCMWEIRRVLGDNATTPRFIESVGRQGYRFIASIATTSPVHGSRFTVQGFTEAEPTPNPQSLTPNFVGREEELAKLQGTMDKALAGQRQMVFVTGEAGVGKTAVVESFLARMQITESVWVGWGQCIEHYGVGEAYLPVLEALGRLGRGAEREQLVHVLRRVAPSWLVQLPALVDEEELEALQRKVQGVPRERMLREFADALEMLTTEQPLVLVLEDLHWSDVSTVELLAFLAHRRESARLLVIGTYRPADAISQRHPLPGLMRELHVHGQCTELRLELLILEDVRTYLSQRLRTESIPTELTEVVYRRTDGNALFMVNFVDSLLARGLVAQVDGRWMLPKGLAAIEVNLPQTLRELLQQQIEVLGTEEQRVLEVASVEGVRFTTAAVAAAFSGDRQMVGAACEEVARRRQIYCPRAGIADLETVHLSSDKRCGHDNAIGVYPRGSRRAEL